MNGNNFQWNFNENTTICRQEIKFEIVIWWLFSSRLSHTNPSICSPSDPCVRPREAYVTWLGLDDRGSATTRRIIHDSRLYDCTDHIPCWCCKDTRHEPEGQRWEYEVYVVHVCFNSLVPGGCGSNFENVNFKLILQIDILSIFCELPSGECHKTWIDSQKHIWLEKMYFKMMPAVLAILELKEPLSLNNGYKIWNMWMSQKMFFILTWLSTSFRAIFWHSGLYYEDDTFRRPTRFI